MKNVVVAEFPAGGIEVQWNGAATFEAIDQADGVALGLEHGVALASIVTEDTDKDNENDCGDQTKG